MDVMWFIEFIEKHYPHVETVANWDYIRYVITELIWLYAFMLFFLMIYTIFRIQDERDRQYKEAERYWDNVWKSVDEKNN